MTLSYSSFFDEKFKALDDVFETIFGENVLPFQASDGNKIGIVFGEL